MKTLWLLLACVFSSANVHAQLIAMTDDQYRASLVKLWEEDEEVLIPQTDVELAVNDVILESPLILSADGFTLDDTILPFGALKSILKSSRPDDQSGKHYWIAIHQQSGSRADEIIDLLVYLRVIDVHYKILR
ncbi:hypothetical protein WBG78_26520 [Chryseolinea sp. T2]|uniref:hypothetical protein n=1 Tax=Chryseolinea sp. T2 TaxID=3129255 RepID=UPI003076F44B